jgi:hypothetical protein
MRLSRQLVLSAFLMAQTVLLMAATEIYQPSHKTAASLLETIEPLFADKAKLSATDRQLILVGDQIELNPILELLLQLDQPALRFLVEISSNPTTAGQRHYTTGSRSALPQRFNVIENQLFIISKQQQSLQVSSMGLWTKLETVPIQQESIALTIQASDNGLMIDYSLRILDQGRFTSVKHQIQGDQGQWLSILSAATGILSDEVLGSGSGNSKIYSTNAKKEDQLFIKVTRQP